MKRRTVAIFGISTLLALVAAVSISTVALAGGPGSGGKGHKPDTTLSHRPLPRGEHQDSLHPNMVQGTVKQLTESAIIIVASDGTETRVPVGSNTRYTLTGNATGTLANLLTGKNVLVLKDKEGKARMVVLLPAGAQDAPRPRRVLHRLVHRSIASHMRAGTVQSISATSITIEVLRPKPNEGTTATFAINDKTKTRARGADNAISAGDLVLVLSPDPRAASPEARQILELPKRPSGTDGQQS